MISRRSILASGALITACGWPTLAQARHCADDRLRLSDGRWLGYRRYGVRSGPPVFYFHGLPGCRLEAGLIECEAIAAGVDLISIDRPGMGNSSFQSCRTISQWVNEVRCLADWLGIGEFGGMGICPEARPMRLRQRGSAKTWARPMQARQGPAIDHRAAPQ